MDKTKLFMDESHFLMYSCYTGKPRINWISFRIFIGFLSFPWDIPSANTETVENYAEYKNPQQPQRLLGILFAVQESVRGKPGIQLGLHLRKVILHAGILQLGHVFLISGIGVGTVAEEGDILVIDRA